MPVLKSEFPFYLQLVSASEAAIKSWLGREAVSKLNFIGLCFVS